MRRLKIAAATAALASALVVLGAPEATPRHGIAMYGDLEIRPRLPAFRLRQPERAKGRHGAAVGDRHLRHAQPLRRQGRAGGRHRLDVRARLMVGLGGRAVQRIRPASPNGRTGRTTAPGSLYTLRQEARFHDGSPMTAEDVMWTFETLRTKGQPMYRSYYGDVDQGREAEGERGVRFTFKSGRQPRIAADPRPDAGAAEAILGGHAISRETTLEPPLGSGPYKVELVRRRAARSPIAASPITGAPTCRSTRAGFNCRHDPLRLLPRRHDRAGGLQGRPIRRAQRELVEDPGRPAMTARRCATGLIKKESIPNQLPSGMQGFGFNLRRPLFQDPRVRQALGLRVRFRMVEQEPVLRPLQAHPQLFRQFRTGRHRRAAGRGAEDPRTLSRQGAGRGLHQGIQPAEDTTAPAISATGCARRSSC